jgi:hypothetical protein
MARAPSRFSLKIQKRVFVKALMGDGIKGLYNTIPIEFMRVLGWRERQRVVVELYGKDKLIIKDWKK